MRSHVPSMGLTLVCWLLCASAIVAEDSDRQTYQEYKRTRRQIEFFEISFNEDVISVSVFRDGDAVYREYPQTQVIKRDGQVVFDDAVMFTRDGLHFDGELYAIDEITDTRALDHDDMVTVTFYTSSEVPAPSRRVRRGNRIEFDRPLIVEDDEFVRGLVFSVAGDIEVYGEVNKDVVSILGDIYVGPGAVARGDLVSVSGRIDVAKDASVYGEVYTKDDRGGRRHRFRRREREVSFSGTFVYNRVDGATPYLGARFEDVDSVLPSVWVTGGHGFASERWRYEFGLEQTIVREPPLAIGGSFYRRLASDDDWLLSNNENTFFALAVTEDFKDYYEAEGGSIWITHRPFSELEINVKYRLEETRWLKEHSHLWSLFGGDKRFLRNFNDVPSPFREAGIAEIDTTQNGYFEGRVDFDTREENDPFARSAWHLTGVLEWSHPDFRSDFDYQRYTIAIRRYQELHRRSMLLLRGMFGGSDGYLPMYKRFYLGGLGTLRGYRHKELMGTRFWMANAEYRIDFPRTDLAVSLLWDLAQIANESKLDEDVEVKHSLGVAVFIGDDFRVNLSRRLDADPDENPRVYVRLEHVF